MFFPLRTENLLFIDKLKKSWLIILGLLVLYVPTFYNLSQTLWAGDEQAHGPLILGIVLYLFWKNHSFFLEEGEPSLFIGSLFFLLGLICYILGRSQDILIFEIGSLSLVLLGLVWGLKGRTIGKHFLFPILFSLFMVPLPGFVVDLLTGSLKRHISEIAEAVLYYCGYPVARQGVVIMVGSYQLLVADACSGLHSIFSLSAVGILYIHLMEYKNRTRNYLLALCIVPIAFFANLCRVIALILITYYLGDEVGQGFIHGFTGIFLFVIALFTLFLLDSVLGMVYKQKNSLQKV